MKIVKARETEIYNIALGLIKGYKPDDNIDVTPFGNVVNKTNPDDSNSNIEKVDIIKKIRKCVDNTEEKTGICLSLKINEAMVLYKHDWGCPESGEPVYDISIIRNDKFNPAEEQFKYAVKILTRLLKEEFKQSTVTLTISSGLLYYYN